MYEVFIKSWSVVFVEPGLCQAESQGVKPFDVVVCLSLESETTIWSLELPCSHEWTQIRVKH